MFIITMLPLAVIFLLCDVKNVHGAETASTLLMDYDTSYDIHHDISYEELREMNADCYPHDTCMADITGDKTCNCNSQCSMYGNCCIDSPYRDNSTAIYQCWENTYMIGLCSNNEDRNSVWKDLCEEKWDEKDDILKYVPVTSLDTNATYKNYYCLRCYETTGNFLYWQLEMLGGEDVNGRYGSGEYATEKIPENVNFRVNYDQNSEVWVVTSKEDNFSIPVMFSNYLQNNWQVSRHSCDSRVISKCSDLWVDKYTQYKCHSYAGMKFVGFFHTYKNVHCALCNFQSLDYILCSPKSIGAIFIETRERRYNFRYIFDINLFHKVERITMCADDEFWHPYSKKCKKIRCAVEGYVIKNEKCVAP